MENNFIVIEHNAYMGYSKLKYFCTLEQAKEYYIDLLNLNITASLVQYKLIK